MNDELNKRVNAATDLQSLADALNSYDETEEPDDLHHRKLEDYVDLTSLPTFGGSDIDREGIFSWDASNVMYPRYGNDGKWIIEPRSDLGL